MGNFNSSSHNQAGNHKGSTQWTQSLELEPPDQRNRMKRGYFQNRNNYGRPAKISPHKVLPEVNPTEAALRLRPTSNGAILLGGGTISCRKLLNEIELDIAKAANNAPSSKIHPETVLSAISRPASKLVGRNDDENYEDYRDSNTLGPPNQFISSNSSQFSKINESPSKKQIRSKKKYQAPLPPPVLGEPRYTKTSELKHKGSKKMNRIFKTKTESKFKLLASGVESELKLQQQRQQSLTKDVLNERSLDRAKHSSFPSHFVVETESMRNQQIRGIPQSSEHHKTTTPTVAVLPKEINSKQHSSHATVQIREAISGHQVPAIALNTSNPRLNSSYVTPSSHKEQVPISSPNKRPEGSVNLNEKYSERASKKNSFYFGMDDSPLHENTRRTPVSSTNNNSNGKKYCETVESATRIVSEKANFEPRLKSESKSTSRTTSDAVVPSNVGQILHPSNINHQQKIKAQINNSNQSKSNRCNYRSESDSEGLQPLSNSLGRRDDGLNLNKIKIQNVKRGNQYMNEVNGTAMSQDSSSDMSSSEMDIPTLIRPTLPQKRNELPSFSPVAAWQALDSPGPSCRSFSSEDGFRYENHVQRFTRPNAPTRSANLAHERSGDSGISAGDAGSPANPEILRDDGNCSGRGWKIKNELSPRHTNASIERPNKCWTPQQDLDDSSSDFEHDVDIPPRCLPTVVSRTVPPISVGPQTPPKLTTRSNLFQQHKQIYGSDCDSRSRNGSDLISDERFVRHHPHGSEMAEQRLSSAGNNRNSAIKENKSVRQRRMASRRNQLNHGNKSQDFLGLDTNWFLSRSEPNSLNETELMMLNEPSDFVRCQDFSPQFEDVLELEGNQPRMRKVGSEIGYGPSNMSFYNHELSCNNDSDPNSLILFRRPLHIMYLPSYDSRRLQSSYPNPRRSKSVDNMDSKNVLFQSPRTKQLQRNNCNPDKSVNLHLENSRNALVSGGTNASNTIDHNVIDSQARTKAKFKFQSTLRVLERKRMQKELTQEARERETKRLSEIEIMRRVEEEFQRKRLKDKQDIDNHALGLVNSSGAQKKGVNLLVTPWESVPGNHDIKTVSGSEISAANSGGGSTASSRDCPSANKGRSGHSQFKASLPQRQEPDGAPASSSSVASNLRKELIHASRKRNGVASTRASSDLTQELSEYRQESRQYCDYRRSPRNVSSSPTRFVEISNGRSRNRKPCEKERSRSRTTTTTIHPEVVCDIPGRRFPYAMNDSRLSGSLSNLTNGDHGGIGGTRSGPSSIISDNYRRDWVHKSSGSVLSGNGQRASSIISLHSAPGFSTDGLRNSATDLTFHGSPSQGFHEKSLNKSKWMNVNCSKPGPMSQISCNSSNASLADFDRNSSAIQVPNRLDCVSSGPGVFQPQPFSAREYRPVVFKPKTSHHKSTFAIIHGVKY